MDAVANTDKITEWLNRQVDPAFAPLIQKIAASGTPIQWEKEDSARTVRVRFGDREVTYTIVLQPGSDPVSGRLLFRTPERENSKPFSPALAGRPKAPGEMTGSDIVNDLIKQYGQWCKHRGVP
jgi:hypothetical protein